MLIPFAKEKNTKSTQETLLLAADVGATKTNLALFDTSGHTFVALHEATFKTSDYSDIKDLTDHFTQGLSAPQTICYAVAGPVVKGRAALSNISWQIDQDELTHHYNKTIHVINDLEATAYGLAALSDKDVHILNKVDGPALGNAAVIAPGTGLGEAGIFWDGQHYHPFATEGGHCDFAPRNAFDFELLSFLQKEFDHVSWELLASGQGIINIYRFLRSEKKLDEPDWLKEKFLNGPDPAVISEHADKCSICKETMEIFIQYLAYESANLVLKTKATGGLFIGGGIAPQIVHLFEKNTFYSSFLKSGRLNGLLAQVPISIILNSKAALLGAAWYAHNRRSSA